MAVAQARRLHPGSGIRVRRVVDPAGIRQPGSGPPRVRLEHAVLVAASGASTEDAAVAVLADACQEGRTTAARLAQALDAVPRLRHRKLIAVVLTDVATGAFSALERRYLVHVERAHGLPRGERQHRVDRPAGRTAYRDVRYPALRTIVELDGSLVHDSAESTWADLDRDLAAAAEGDLTLRIRWGQVLEPCRLAVAIARVLALRGWTGRPRACGLGCPVAEKGDLPAPGAGRSPFSD